MNISQRNMLTCLALLCNISTQSMEQSSNNPIGWQNLSRDLKKKILNQCLVISPEEKSDYPGHFNAHSVFVSLVYSTLFSEQHHLFGRFVNFSKDLADDSTILENPLTSASQRIKRSYNRIASTPNPNSALAYHTDMCAPEKKDLLLFDLKKYHRTFFPYPLDVNFHSPQFHPHDPSFLVITQDNKVAVITINNAIPHTDFITEANAYCAMMIDAIPDRITSAHFSPDGTQIAVGTHNGPVYIYDMQTQKCIAQTSVQAMVHSLTFSPDKKLFVSHQLPDGLTCCDIAAQSNHSLPVTGMPTKIACSPTGEHLVYATTNPPSFTIVNQRTKQACTTPFPYEVTDIIFSPDNNILKICFSTSMRQKSIHKIFQAYYNFMQYKQREKILDQASGNDRYMPFVGKLCLPNVQAKSAEKTN